MTRRPAAPVGDASAFCRARVAPHRRERDDPGELRRFLHRAQRGDVEHVSVRDAQKAVVRAELNERLRQRRDRFVPRLRETRPLRVAGNAAVPQRDGGGVGEPRRRRAHRLRERAVGVGVHIAVHVRAVAAVPRTALEALVPRFVRVRERDHRAKRQPALETRVERRRAVPPRRVQQRELLRRQRKRLHQRREGGAGAGRRRFRRFAFAFASFRRVIVHARVLLLERLLLDRRGAQFGARGDGVRQDPRRLRARANPNATATRTTAFPNCDPMSARDGARR